MKSVLKNFWPENRKARLIGMGLILVAFFLGWTLNSGKSTPPHQHDHEVVAASLWTCSMHPQIQQPQPGKCPLCGMDLIPVTQSGTQDRYSRLITLSETARKLAEIEVATVTRMQVTHGIRLVGKIDYDETRLSFISARVPGRIDRLYADYTGMTVRQGDPLVELYSPELLSAQQELAVATRNLKSAQVSGQIELSQLAAQQQQSVQQRLRLWGLSDEQVAALERQAQPSDHITLYAPAGGIVTEKNALVGQYIETGTQIYKIADLTQVWALLEAYESDLTWLRVGQAVNFTVDSYPSDVYSGTVAFIDPLVDPDSRTIQIRVSVKNQNLKLKPGMLVNAQIEAIVTSDPGNRLPPLVIPASAPLITGKRAVVYLAVPGQQGTYEGRVIELGPRAGDYYLVRSGLAEGDRVVVRGNFKIDSAIQIMAQPSMMNPATSAPVSSPVHAHSEPDHVASKNIVQQSAVTWPERFQAELDTAYQIYFEIQHALSHDELASEPADQLLTRLIKISGADLKAQDQKLWLNKRQQAQIAAEKISAAKDLKAARSEFEPLSEAFIGIAQIYGSRVHQLLVYHCPMAFDNRGANWLQNKTGTENPYFGSAMFSCGSQIADYSTK